MYCPHCGTSNLDGASRCSSCLQELPALDQSQATPQAPSDNEAAQPPDGPQPPIYQQPAQGGYGYQAPSAPPRPGNFLAGNIVMTVLGLCSCIGVITGIIGIIFSSMVNGRYNEGNYAAAKSNATVAKVMFFVTLGIVVIALLYWIFAFVSAFQMMGSLDLDELMRYYEYYY